MKANQEPFENFSMCIICQKQTTKKLSKNSKKLSFKKHKELCKLLSEVTNVEVTVVNNCLALNTASKLPQNNVFQHQVFNRNVANKSKLERKILKILIMLPYLYPGKKEFQLKQYFEENTKIWNYREKNFLGLPHAPITTTTALSANMLPTVDFIIKFMKKLELKCLQWQKNKKTRNSN